MGDRALIAYVALAGLLELHNNSCMKTKVCLSVCGVLVCLCVEMQFSVVITRAIAGDEGGVYYVDSQNGSDAAPGDSAARAWRSLGKVNATTFHPGDRILLMSDGVVEARHGSGELFGFDRVHNLSNQSAFYIADAAKTFGQEDDITVLTVRRLAQAIAA